MSSPRAPCKLGPSLIGHLVLRIRLDPQVHGYTTKEIINKISLYGVIAHRTHKLLLHNFLTRWALATEVMKSHIKPALVLILLSISETFRKCCTVQQCFLCYNLIMAKRNKFQKFNKTWKFLISYLAAASPIQQGSLSTHIIAYYGSEGPL